MTDIINYFVDPINKNGIGHFFSMSTWQSGIAFIFLIISIFVIGLTIWKKDKFFALIPAFILGIVGIFIFIILMKNYEIPPIIDDEIYWNTEAYNWLNLMSNIFISLIAIVIPIYIFVLVILFIVKENLNKIKRKTMITSFGSLIFLSIFGMIVAFAMIPLISLLSNLFVSIDLSGDEITDYNSLPNMISNAAGNSLLIFTNLNSILAVVIFSILIGISIRLTFKNEKEKLESTVIFFENFKRVIVKYFSIVILLVPFVICTKLASIGLKSVNASDYLKLMISYMGIFLIGAGIIIITFYTLNIFLSKEKFSKKNKILISQFLMIFASQSISSSVIETQDNAKKLGVSDEISELTITKGTIMGMAMCNGFTPMLIILFSIFWSNGGVINWEHIIIAFFVILCLTFSISGAGSADYTIIIATLGTLGISTLFYTTIIMPVQELNEITLAKPTNTLGHLVASQVTNKIYEKQDNKK